MKYVKASGEADVYLNGDLQTHVLEADDEAGEVLLGVTDYRTGKLIENPDLSYGCESVLVKGTVVIKVKESPSSSSSSESYHPWGYPPYGCGVVEGYVLGMENGAVVAYKRLIPRSALPDGSSQLDPYLAFSRDGKAPLIRSKEFIELFQTPIIDRTEEDREMIRKAESSTYTDTEEYVIGLLNKHIETEMEQVNIPVEMSVTREVMGLYRFGKLTKKDFVKDSRGIAGTMVFTSFDKEKDLEFVFGNPQSSRKIEQE